MEQGSPIDGGHGSPWEVSPPRTASHLRPGPACALPSPDRMRAACGIATHWISDLVILTKARVNVLVVATSFVGFGLHADIPGNWQRLLNTMLGTGLVAGGAAVTNQALELRFDRNMARTRNRPLAAGRIPPGTATWLGGTLFGAGCFWLGAEVNLGAALLAALAFSIYAFVYTPLKRQTPACMFVGAIAGALPVLIGWAATGADFGLWTFVAFMGLFLWQLPHVLAIAWWRRLEYHGAGFRMLDPSDYLGARTAGQALVFALCLVAASLLPWLTVKTSGWYLPGVLASGIAFIGFAIRFRVKRDEAAARGLFIASLWYLPALYSLMLACTDHF